MSKKEQTPKPDPDETREDFGPKEDDPPRTLAEVIEKFKREKETP